MTTGPRQHDDHDQRDPRRDADREGREGRAVHRADRSVFTSLAGNVAFLVVLSACAGGVLLALGRETGAVAVVGVNAFTLASYLVFRRSLERVEASALEGLVSWLVWTVLVGAATVCYALDWRIMGAIVLAVVLVLTFANTYVLVMHPEMVDDLMRRARENDDDPRD